jgi:hypothetical protein
MHNQMLCNGRHFGSLAACWNYSANAASLSHACMAAWLQVSWLGAWTLLLGCRDFKTEADMLTGLPCLRPEEEDMLEVARLWARISAAAEVRH